MTMVDPGRQGIGRRTHYVRTGPHVSRLLLIDEIEPVVGITVDRTSRTTRHCIDNNSIALVSIHCFTTSS